MIVKNGIVIVEDSEKELIRMLNGHTEVSDGNINKMLHVARRVWYDATSQKAVDVAIRAAKSGMITKPLTEIKEASNFKCVLNSDNEAIAKRNVRRMDEALILNEMVTNAIVTSGTALEWGYIDSNGTAYRANICMKERHEEGYLIIKYSEGQGVGRQWHVDDTLDVLKVIKGNGMFATDVRVRVPLKEGDAYEHVGISFRRKDGKPSEEELQAVKRGVEELQAVNKGVEALKGQGRSLKINKIIVG